MVDIASHADRVDGAAHRVVAINQSPTELSETDAYRIQAASVRKRLERGERRLGVKMGFTSRAKMLQMGIGDVIWGRLTDAMIVEEGGFLDLSRYIHPRVEPEIAFLIGKPINSAVTALQAQDAIAGIAPAMEIIDSRYEDFKFSLGDVIADNASSAGLVVGSWNAPQTKIANLGMVMSFDGLAVEIGSSAAILGHPLRALVAAARLLTRDGESLSPGDIVLAGAATPAHILTPGLAVRLEVQTLGAVEFAVRGSR